MRCHSEAKSHKSRCITAPARLDFRAQVSCFTMRSQSAESPTTHCVANYVQQFGRIEARTSDEANEAFSYCTKLHFGIYMMTNTAEQPRKMDDSAESPLTAELLHIETKQDISLQHSRGNPVASRTAIARHLCEGLPPALRSRWTLFFT